MNIFEIARYNLIFGWIFFANESNIGFYEELESKPQVSYITGKIIRKYSKSGK